MYLNMCSVNLKDIYKSHAQHNNVAMLDLLAVGLRSGTKDFNQTHIHSNPDPKYYLFVCLGLFVPLENFSLT